MQTLLHIVLALAGTSLLLTAATHVACRKVQRRPIPQSLTPAVSILKPLKGADENLYANLVSLARQDYPNFEIILGCEDPHDPALAIARRLQEEFSCTRIVVVAGARRAGMNPKVNNLRLLFEQARHDVILISDACVRAEPGYLRALAGELAKPRVGLVSSLLVGTGERSFGARLDSLHMNSFVIRGVCGAEVLASHPCVIGKSMMFRRGDWARLGGFQLVENVLAEDYVLGRRFAEAGFRVALSPYPVRSYSGRRTVREFWARHLRWGQMRRQLSPLIYFAEPLHSPIPWLLAALLLVVLGAASGAAVWVSAAISLALAARLASDAAIAASLRGARLQLADFAAIIFKDVLYPAIWLYAAFKRSVEWQGTRLRIGPGSELFLPEGEADRAGIWEST